MSDNEIEVLAEIEHIRIRPDMYTKTDDPAHILTEVIDNSLDELANGHADNITINIDNENNVCSIEDNGRGIPRHEVSLPDGTKEDSVIVACTKLFSGGKFNLNNYETSIGLHGVGLVVLNALSLYMQVSIRNRDDKSKTYVYTFKDAEIVQQIETENNDLWSTKVSFQPNTKYFSSAIIPIDKIKTRLFLVASKFPQSNILLNNEKVHNLPFDKFCMGILEVKNDVSIINATITEKGFNADVFFAYEEDSKLMPTIMGDVNLNICQGTYLSTLTTLFCKVVNEIVDDERLTKPDILNNLRLYCSMTISEPKFQGQTKDRMISDVKVQINKLYTELKSKLNTFTFKERFKKIIDEKSAGKAIKKLQKKGKRLSADNPTKDCLKIPGETLYLLEGDSATGNLKAIRDRTNEAILPLTGKISNTINKNVDQALDSKKMKFLLEAIGIHQDDGYRYNKIKVLCDADSDGLHISVLACTAIWKYFPQLIEENRLIIILPPLYGARKKGKPFVPIYKLEDTKQYKDQGYTIKRFKGLGEMNKDELKEVVYKNPLEYTVKLPETEKDIESVTQCLINTELKRKICSDERFGLQRIFNNIHKQLNKQGN